MLKRVIKVLMLFFLGITLSFGEDITLERLEELKSKDMISQEDYEFLKAELTGELKETHYFSLFINRTLVSNTFQIAYKNNYTYIPLRDYFKAINFKNYNFRDGVLEMFLGKRLQRVMINFNTREIKGIEKTTFDERDFYLDGDKYYLRLEFFRDIFLNAVDIDYPKTRLSMSSRYTLPNDIKRLVSQTEEELKKDQSTVNMFYTNERELLGLGYMRFNFDKTFTKIDGEDDNDWTGTLDYQGPLLYGTFRTEYDVKDGKFNSTSLRYDNLPYNHFLEFRGTRINEDGYWEKSILFEKDKGYYEDGKKFIIREDVPIGSRVELIYLGATIAVAYEKNGVVTFDNNEIKSDREYLLKIHTRDGHIQTRVIKTSDDFNQQNRGEFQYRLFATEVHYTDGESDRDQFETELFYGLTDRLTFGATYSKMPEVAPISKDSDETKLQYIEKAGGEIVYSNFLKTYPYTFIIGGEKILTPDVYEEDSMFEGMFQIKYENLKIRYEEGYYSEYYDSKESRGITLEYDPWEFLRIDYSYQWLTDWEENKENGYELDVELTKNFGRFLTTFEFERDLNNEKRYSLNLYYTGYRDYSVRWNNSITEAGGDYESTLSLYNRATQNGLDYSFEVSYNEKDKEKFTFRISLDYDNWFNFDMTARDSGDLDVSAGVDRIVDLRNIKKPLDSMDTSRVKVSTFLDINDNNKYDKGEPFVGDVEVDINGEKKVTSSKEPTYFFGIPNDILYEFTPKVRRPGYDTVNMKFSLKGKGGGDINVYIPIKPLFSISGRLNLENKTEDEKITIYDGVVVKIKDSKGEILDSMLLDHLGYYDISGLVAGKYELEITSFKNLKIKPLKMDLDLKYDEKIGNNIIVNSTIKDSKISLID